MSRLILCCCSLLLFAEALALATPESPLVQSYDAKNSQLTKQRVHYGLAKTALSNKDSQAFDRHYAMLGDYPLAPYLDFTRLRASLSQLEYDEYDLFLAANKNSFLEARFRQHLLYQLGLLSEWEAFARYYKPEGASTELRCFHLYGRYKRGDLTALDEVEHIWIAGKSLPKECDALFAVWKSAGMLSSPIAWKRFIAAMNAGNTSLARYVRKSMKGRYLRYADQMLHVRAYPYSIRKRGTFLEQSREMQQIIAHGIQRYARVNPVDALKQWELYEAQQIFPAEISVPTKIQLAKRLTRKGHSNAAESLIKGSSEIQMSDVIEQQIRLALENEDWEKVLQWLDSLNEEKQQSDRWLYWRARAQAEQGVLTGPYGHFVDIYATLAGRRSFYGFLAADKLGTEYALQAAPENVNPSSIITVAAIPAMRRARELWLTGSQAEAQAEWGFAIRDMNRQELLAAGTLARQWGWYNGGINAMISGNLWDQLSLRFPLAFKDEVLKAANQTQLDPTLIYAVARQESAFSETARSSAGAMGLMQLMPTTAKQTARKAGVPHTNQDLYKAEHNINLGSRYLNQLIERYDGNRIFATAAYNAGPHRVNRWLKERANISFDVWIETIPFRETRGYVQNVLAYTVIYAHQLGKTGNLLTEKEAN